jgi:acetylglutamate kinase
MTDMKPMVLKVGGSELDHDEYVQGFAAAVRDLNRPVVVVHGGGKEISTFQSRLGIKTQYVDGVRVTDADTLQLAEMVLCGLINKRLVRHFIEAGVDAMGLSGVDRGLIRAEKQVSGEIDMGLVGRIVSVRGEVLLDLLAQGVTPIVAPISLGEGTNYNVNADHAAGAIASAIGAERIVFMTNVPGVLMGKQVARVLIPAEVERLIEAGTINKGMVPKVRTAVEMLGFGISEAVITNFDGLAAGTGTRIRPEQQSVK